MKQAKVFTYSKQYQVKEFDVFILSKGLNSGKPLDAPCPNCFVISCSSKAIANYYGVLCYGLHKAKHFHQLLTGSVIPFLRIDDFKKEIAIQCENINKNPEAFTADVNKIKLMEEKQKVMQQQIQLLGDLKRAILYRHLKR
jgi:hypothetical protein